MKNKQRILIADDDANICELVRLYLEKEGYETVVCFNGEKALEIFRAGGIDLAILDIMMPKKDGLEVLKALRNLGSKTPIMLLTAKSEIEDQVLGLDAGADDYLPKPFSMELLLAHVRALLRRRSSYMPRGLSFGNVELDQDSHELSVGNQKIVLGKLEYQIMELLMLNHERYFSTEDILCKIWYNLIVILLLHF